jgi:hypothetical protein
MSVSAQIFNYLFGSGKRLLGVNNPVVFVQAINKLLCLWQILLKGFSKLTPEDSGKALDTEQKHFVIFRGTYLFPLPSEVDSSAGNNTMDMRVQAKVLSPCMQYGYHACFCMQLCVRKLSYCFPCACKQQVIKNCRMLKKKTIECIRYSKYHMKVWDRKQILLVVFHPCFPLSILALGTMTVTARVITDTDMTALIAFIKWWFECIHDPATS